MRLFKTRVFQRFALNEGIEDAVLLEAAKRVSQGLVATDLGSGLFKQRVARKGSGESGGYRTLLAYKEGERIIFLHGFAKNKQDNITATELKNLKILAKQMLLYDNETLNKLLITHELVEVFDEI